MAQRRKLRPAVDGMEQRLALNATLGGAGLAAHLPTSTAQVMHMSHGHTTHGHTTHGHTTHGHTTHHKGK